MATSYYSTGSVTLTNGSAVVTGVGTLWQSALIDGGNVIVDGGYTLPIQTVDSDTQITAELRWTGANGTYSYAIQRDSAYRKALDKNSENLSYVISEIRNGTLFKYDVAGDEASRATYNGRQKGFSYLVVIGVDEPILYVKASNAEGDWAGPFSYGTGPQGEMGPVGFLNWRGTYASGTVYARNDGVYYNGSAWVALQATIGNAPPALPTTENANWSLLAIKGQDGAGIGDMLTSVYDPQGRQTDVFAAIDLRPWELIANLPFASVASISRTGLADYEFIRGTLTWAGSLNSQLAFRSSVNNGSSYESGASDYSYQAMVVTESSIAGVSSVNNVLLLSSMVLAVNQNSMQFCLSNFNKAAQMRMTSYAFGASTSGPPLLMFLGGSRQSPTARNALQIFPAAGGTISGHLVLEGIRG